MTQEREDEVMATEESKTTLENILTRAKNCKLKGRLYVYESFKSELQALNLTGIEYADACRDLARYLGV